MPDYYGRPTAVLENAFLRLEYLSTGGPRIVRLFAGGSDFNLLAEMPDFSIATPHGDYHFIGGHRLWHSPEAMPRTYIPDDYGLQVQELEDGVRLLQPAEGPTSIQKTLEIHLHPNEAAVTLHHRLENTGLWPVELAPWAITQLQHGGVAIVPQQRPDDPRNLLLPDRLLAIWSYTVLADPRLHLADDYVLVDGNAAQPPCKVGLLNKRGWAGYLNHGVLLLKRFSLRFDGALPDYGVNTEVYVDHRFIELETLGPMTMLQPGQWVGHTETWELISGIDVPQTLDGVRELAHRLGLSG